jgi:DNA-binding LytR/AlgR family response regulator
MSLAATAILVEDEQALRIELRAALARFWPELAIVGEAADGVSGARLLSELTPQIAFLDVRMPGLNGVELARLAAGRCHVVFLTAYNDYAVDAFDHGAVDYLLKPLDLARLAVTVTRLQTALGKRPADLSMLPTARASGPLQWIQASSGGHLRFIGINDVQCFCAEAKYTCVVTARFEAHIRTPLKDLLGQLDPAKFWPVSRSAIVNVGAIDSVQRIDGTLSVRLANSSRWLAVSQAYQHQFRQM